MQRKQAREDADGWLLLGSEATASSSFSSMNSVGTMN